jgi:23S rRNA (guanosine2251-2'-O)-methyltransferase
MAVTPHDRYSAGMKSPSSSGRTPGGSGSGHGGKGPRSPSTGRGAGAPHSRPRGNPAAPRGGGAPHAAPRAPRISAPDAPPATHQRPAPRAATQGARPQAPSGTIWLYGTHPVAAALANPARRLRRLLVTEEAEATLAGILKGSFSVQPERIERGRLDHLLGHDAVHQGVALLADPLPQPALATVLERSGPLLVLDQVTDPRNVGAILRSAAAFGVAGVIAQDRNAPEETGALAKAASGAMEIVPLIRAVNLSRTLVALKAAGLWTVGLAADASPLRGEALRERRVALVLGAEGAGMRRLTRETCDELAGLAMPGDMESLNVSAAAAVALYELTRG